MGDSIHADGTIQGTHATPDEKPIPSDSQGES